MTQANFKHTIASQTGTINYYRILRSFLKYWYYFVLSVVVFVAGVNVMHRYSLPVYQASGTLMLKASEDQSMVKTGLMEGFGLSPEMRNIENQTFIIKSYSIIQRAIANLDFGIEYYADGWGEDVELYQTSPFTIIADSSVLQPIDIPIFISFLPNHQAEVTIESEGGNLYNLKSNAIERGFGALSFKKIVNVNESFESPLGAFVIRCDKADWAEGQSQFYFKFRSVDGVTSQYRSALSVGSYSEGSSILYLSVTGKTPQKLRRFIDELALVVCDHNLEQKNELASRSINFIAIQLEMISDTLKKAQDLLLQFRKENRFMEPSVVSQNLADQYFEVVKKQKELLLKRDYFTFLKSKLIESPYSTDFMLPAFAEDNNAMVSKLVFELLELNNEYLVNNSQANVTNPYQSVVQQKIEVTRNNLFLAIDKVLQNIALEEDVLRKDIAVNDVELNKLPQLEREYLEIERTYKLNDAIYSFLLQKHSENQITKASNAPDNIVVDKATISGIVLPNTKNDYTKAIAFALLLPGLIIGLLEFFNLKVMSKTDLDHLVPEVPLIGIIPHSKSDGVNVMLAQPHSVISESFRSLRTRLNFMAANKGSRVISITSTNVGDGKTFVSLNISSAFAIAGKKTILLGFDLRKPRLSEYFDLLKAKGISNYLIGEVDIEDIVYKTEQAGLLIMPAGDIPPNPSELIESERTKKLFKWLHQNFDVIIVDLPPVGVVTDARLLMPYTDIHLYVTRYNHTSKDHLKHTIVNLLNENVASLGLVFNDVQDHVDGYGSYYSEYYGKNM